MPAPAISAASVQNGAPTCSPAPATRRRARRTGGPVGGLERVAARDDPQRRLRRRSRAAPARPARRSRRDRAALARQHAARGIARELLAALDQRRVQRRRARRAGGALRLAAARRALRARRGSGPSSRSRQRRDPAASRARRRPRSRSRSRRSRGARRRPAARSARRRSRRRRCTRSSTASVPIDASSSSATAVTITSPRRSVDLRGREQDRGERALHVVRAAAVEPAVLDARLERRLHPCDADRVEVPVQEQRATAARAARVRDRRSGARPPTTSTSSPCAAHQSATNARDLALARAAGMSAGLTESIATSRAASSVSSVTADFRSVSEVVCQNLVRHARELDRVLRIRRPLAGESLESRRNAPRLSGKERNASASSISLSWADFRCPSAARRPATGRCEREPPSSSPGTRALPGLARNADARGVSARPLRPERREMLRLLGHLRNDQQRVEADRGGGGVVVADDRLNIAVGVFPVGS